MLLDYLEFSVRTNDNCRENNVICRKMGALKFENGLKWFVLRCKFIFNTQFKVSKPVEKGYVDFNTTYDTKNDSFIFNIRGHFKLSHNRLFLRRCLWY